MKKNDAIGKKSETEYLNKIRLLEEQLYHKNNEYQKNLAKVISYQNKLGALEEQLSCEKEKIKKSYSFRLGYLLIHSTKSFSNFFHLPIELYKLYLENKNRKALSKKTNKSNNNEIYFKKNKLSNIDLNQLDNINYHEYRFEDIDSDLYLSLNEKRKFVLDNLLNDAEDISIKISCRNLKTNNLKPAGILKFGFLDELGNVVHDLKYTNLSWSKHLTCFYFYISSEFKDEQLIEVKLIKPSGIKSIEIIFEQWASNIIEVQNNLLITRKPSIYTLVNQDFAPILNELKSTDYKYSRYINENTKLCYVLNQSLPYQSEGYATRAQGVAKAIQQEGAELVCITRPGYPSSFIKELKEKKVPTENVIDNVVYQRITSPVSWKGTHVYIQKAAQELEKKFLELKPSCVIAASDYRNAMPALIAAKRLGIPFIYEVRGFWEVTHLSRDPHIINTSTYHLTRYMETEVVKYADYVFTLTNAMRDDLVSRGIDSSKIGLLPNSCDPSQFDPAKNKRDKKLAKKLGIPSNIPVIGYIGTFNDYEGLDDLVTACGLLYQKGMKFRLLLVGSKADSEESNKLRSIAMKYEFEHWLIIPGRIEHNEVASYYSLITIAPFTRKPLPVTELVSPLKPLEALAMGKAVVASSVQALSEMIIDETTGLIYEKGNVNDLYDKLLVFLNDSSKCSNLGKNARKWVVENRTWKLCAKKVIGKSIELQEEFRKTRSLVPMNHKIAKLPHDYTVAFIADEFTFNSFKDEFKAIIIEPTTWLEQFESQKPDIFFCESAWSGVDSIRRPWQGKIYTSINWKKENRTILLDILDYCRINGIPTVFWNKEDPTHFTDRVHDFIATAKEFDYVFTTAEECCESYRVEYGVQNVFALPFATNPKLFNPIETKNRENKVVFAGSWYANHEQRSIDMKAILDDLISKKIDIEIIDRYFDSDDELHKWPVNYQSYIKPGQPHKAMPDVYRSGVFGLNFNTVTESKTMFARRVFELMSSNTLVVSNYSRGVDDMFGDLVIFADKDPERISKLSSNDIAQLREKALNLVLSKHTYKNRWCEILTKIGMPWIHLDISLTLVFKVESENDILLAVNNFQNQFSHNESNKLLLLISKNVDPLCVSQFYEKYNRVGICVTSEKHILEYSLQDKYFPLSTSYFVLANKNCIPEFKWVEQALPHFQYINNVCIGHIDGKKYEYTDLYIDASYLIGNSLQFSSLIKNSNAQITAYMV